MAPGRKCDGRKAKKKNVNFSVGNKGGVVKGSKSSITKKGKDKAVSKKKLKEQTTKWIEDVNESFTTLHPALVDKNITEESTKSTNKNCVNKKEVDSQTFKSDVTEAEIAKTITNMANLLEQS